MDEAELGSSARTVPRTDQKSRVCMFLCVCVYIYGCVSLWWDPHPQLQPQDTRSQALGQVYMSMHGVRVGGPLWDKSRSNMADDACSQLWRSPAVSHRLGKTRVTGCTACPVASLGFLTWLLCTLRCTFVPILLLSTLATSQSSFLFPFFSPTSLMSIIHPQNWSFYLFFLSTIVSSEFITSQNFNVYLSPVISQPCYLPSVSLTRNSDSQIQLPAGYFLQTSCC